VCIAVRNAVFQTFAIFIDTRITVQIAGAPAPSSRPTGRHLLTVKTGVRSDKGYLIMKSDDEAVPPRIFLASPTNAPYASVIVPEVCNRPISQHIITSLAPGSA